MSLTVDDLIPAVKPAYGAATARVVLDIVRRFPEHHLQNYFEIDASWLFNTALGDKCGTTRCVAGWTTFVHLGRWTDSWDARQMLGISNDDAERLFYEMREDVAVDALEYLAKGEPIDWEALDARHGPLVVAFE